MIAKRSLQTTVIKIALFVLGSLLLGKYLLLPNLKYLPQSISAFLLGAALVIAIVMLAEFISGKRLKIRITEIIKEIFPKDLEELKKIGVKNELDFCFAMMETFTVAEMSLTTNTISNTVYYNRKLFNRSIELFEQMFGRKPEASWSLDWRYITQVEANRVLGTGTSYDTFRSKVSLNVRKYFDNEEYMKKRICESQNGGGLQK